MGYLFLIQFLMSYSCHCFTLNACIYSTDIIMITSNGWRPDFSRQLLSVSSLQGHHRQVDCLFNCLFRLTPKKISNTALPFVRGIHRLPRKGWLVDSAHQGHMMMSPNGNIFRVAGPLCGEFTGPGEFPTQRPVTRSFDVFFDLRLN